MDASHYGTTPKTFCDAILSAMSAFQMVDGGQGGGGSGCVKTIARIKDKSKEAIAAALASGVPAILLFYAGGKYESVTTMQQQWDDALTFTLYSISGTITNIDKRMDAGDRDIDTAINPGVEELQDWSLYYAARALRTNGAKKIIPLTHTQPYLIAPETFIAEVTLQASRYIDIYDDALATSLTTLGLVHDPSDVDDLFEADNTTPKSDEPPSTAGGVYTL